MLPGLLTDVPIKADAPANATCARFPLYHVLAPPKITDNSLSFVNDDKGVSAVQVKAPFMRGSNIFVDKMQHDVSMENMRLE